MYYLSRNNPKVILLLKNLTKVGAKELKLHFHKSKQVIADTGYLELQKLYQTECLRGSKIQFASLPCAAGSSASSIKLF